MLNIQRLTIKTKHLISNTEHSIFNTKLSTLNTNPTLRNNKHLAGPAKCGVLSSTGCEETVGGGRVFSTSHQQAGLSFENKEKENTPSMFK